MDFWFGISKTQQILYVLASILTVLLVFDILMFIFNNKKKVDFKSEKIISDIFGLRTLLIFFTVGLWASILASKILPTYLLSFLSGFGFAFIITVIYVIMLKYLSSVKEQNAVDLTTLIGQKAIVYSLIKGKGEGQGKVSVDVNNEMRVFKAIAYEDNKIITGKNVKIVDVLGKDLLLVERSQED
jgi:membrane protein implicated in regulation of membrane protease activity